MTHPWGYISKYFMFSGLSPLKRGRCVEFGQGKDGLSSEEGNDGLTVINVVAYICAIEHI